VTTLEDGLLCFLFFSACLALSLAIF
jgi:hypothetical protein